MNVFHVLRVFATVITILITVPIVFLIKELAFKMLQKLKMLKSKILLFLKDRFFNLRSL